MVLLMGWNRCGPCLIKDGIVVFPGFEIASSEKIHFVCLFDESLSSQTLYGYLGALGVDGDPSCRTGAKIRGAKLLKVHQ